MAQHAFSVKSRPLPTRPSRLCCCDISRTLPVFSFEPCARLYSSTHRTLYMGITTCKKTLKDKQPGAVKPLIHCLGVRLCTHRLLYNTSHPLNTAGSRQRLCYFRWRLVPTLWGLTVSYGSRRRNHDAQIFVDFFFTIPLLETLIFWTCSLFLTANDVCYLSAEETGPPKATARPLHLMAGCEDESSACSCSTDEIQPRLWSSSSSSATARDSSLSCLFLFSTVFLSSSAESLSRVPTGLARPTRVKRRAPEAAARTTASIVCTAAVARGRETLLVCQMSCTWVPYDEHTAHTSLFPAPKQ